MDGMGEVIGRRAGDCARGVRVWRAAVGVGLAGMLAGAAVCAGQTTTATYAWQKMQMPTAAEVSGCGRRRRRSMGRSPTSG